MLVYKISEFDKNWQLSQKKCVKHAEKAEVLCLDIHESLAVCKVEKCEHEPRHVKTNKVTVRPAKTQVSLGIRPVWSESSLCA